MPAEYLRAHEKNSVASALFIAYEPERNGREFMRITGHGLEGKVMEVKDYSEMPWYKQSIETGRGQWYEPFIGVYADQPVALFAMWSPR